MRTQTLAVAMNGDVVGTLFRDGKNRQYHFAMIQPRHFISPAAHVGFSKEVAANLMRDMADQAENVISQVSTQLPPDFPEHISSTIFSGLARKADKIRRMES